MSEPERELRVPLVVQVGVSANDVLVFGDVEDATLDFARVAPHDPEGIVVARVTLPWRAYSN